MQKYACRNFASTCLKCKYYGNERRKYFCVKNILERFYHYASIQAEISISVIKTLNDVHDFLF